MKYQNISNDDKNFLLNITSNKNKNYWLIHGNKYYLDDYIDKHPGGKIAILSGRNRDCTNLFESYHIWNENHRKVLEKYDPNFILPKPEPIYQEFKEMIREKYPTKKEQFKTKMPLNILFLYNIICIIQLYFIRITNNNLLILLLGYFYSMFSMRLVHEGGHFALSKNNIINYINQLVMFPYFGWIGWHHQHFIGHHQETNNEKDPDVYFINKYKIDKIHPIKRSIFFIFLCWLAVFQYITHGVALFIKEKSVGQKYMFNTKIPLIIEFILCLYLNIYLNWNPLKYFIFLLGSGFEFLPTSQIAHLILYPSNTSDIWIKQQIKESVNFGINNNSLFWRIWFFGLNTQIEHHIFPSISHECHYSISKDVEKICNKHNIPYRSLSIFNGFKALIKRIWYGKPQV
jgi:linoleoyl-CoA desaturase